MIRSVCLYQIFLYRSAALAAISARLFRSSSILSKGLILPPGDSTLAVDIADIVPSKSCNFRIKMFPLQIYAYVLNFDILSPITLISLLQTTDVLSRSYLFQGAPHWVQIFYGHVHDSLWQVLIDPKILQQFYTFLSHSNHQQ